MHDGSGEKLRQAALCAEDLLARLSAGTMTPLRRGVTLYAMAERLYAQRRARDGFLPARSVRRARLGFAAGSVHGPAGGARDQARRGLQGRRRRRRGGRDPDRQGRESRADRPHRRRRQADQRGRRADDRLSDPIGLSASPSPASDSKRRGMTEPLHILVTGTSRGIGAVDPRRARRPSRRRPFERGRRRPDRRRPRRSPRAPTALWCEALARARRADRRAGQQCRHLRGGADRRRPTPTGRRPGSGRCGSTCAPRPTSAGSPCSISASAGRAAGSSTSPAAPPIAATAPTTGIMPRPRRAWSAMTKTIARAYAGEGIYAFTVCPGLHRHRHGRGLYREPRRPRLARRPADRPARDHRRGRRDGALARARRAAPRRPAR